MTFRYGLCGLAAAWVLIGCASQQRMVMPDTTGGSRYSCGTERACKPSTRDVPADNATSGTDFVVGPRECQGRVHEIIVRDDEIEVVCAPVEEPISDMQ